MTTSLRPSRARRGALGLLLGLAASAAAAAEADASRIVYVCGDELCAVDPDSGAKAQLTSDGAEKRYRHPSISRDGSRVAAASGYDVLVGAYGANPSERWASSRDVNDVALAPDGGAVGESHSYVHNVNRFRCTPFGGCDLVLVLEDVSDSTWTSGSTPMEGTRTWKGGGGVGFLGGALLSSFYTLANEPVPAHHTVCVVATPSAPEQDCVPRIRHPETLNDPTGSPDGALIAVAVGDPDPATTSSVQLFDAATGAPVRTLARDAGSPAFSPDGRQVAYAGGDGWIHVVATAGGRSRRVIAGHSPTWGGGTPPGGGIAGGPRVASASLRYRGGRIAVVVRCGGSRRCAGTLRIAKGKTPLGSRRYRVKAGKRATVAVRVSARGRRALARGKRHRVTVRLAPARGKAVGRTLLLRR